MSNEHPVDDLDLGNIDGARMWIAPRYTGDLTEHDRRRIIANAALTVNDVIAYDAQGAPRCTGTDCTPASHDRLASFRVELRDLLYLSLNFAMIPSDMPET